MTVQQSKASVSSVPRDEGPELLTETSWKIIYSYANILSQIFNCIQR
jgi:hypothetical protein